MREYQIFDFMDSSWRQKEELDMLDKKMFLISLLIAMFVVLVVGTFTKFVFPDWASENRMIIAITVGGILGFIYPLVVRYMGNR